VLAILVTTVVGGALFLLSIVAGDVYALMVNFTTGGFYLAFLFPLIGFVVVLARRQWRDGAFSLGRATVPVAVLAAVWAVLQMLNISWPRPVYDQRYLDWSVWIGVAVVLAVGLATLAGVRRRIVGAEVTEELGTARV
jgi:amino acid transporter